LAKKGKDNAAEAEAKTEAIEEVVDFSEEVQNAPDADDIAFGEIGPDIDTQLDDFFDVGDTGSSDPSLRMIQLVKYLFGILSSTNPKTLRIFGSLKNNDEVQTQMELEMWHDIFPIKVIATIKDLNLSKELPLKANEREFVKKAVMLILEGHSLEKLQYKMSLKDSIMSKLGRRRGPY